MKKMNYKYGVTDLEKFIKVKNRGTMKLKNFLKKTAEQLPPMQDEGRRIDHYLRLRRAYLEGGMERVNMYVEWVEGKIQEAIDKEKHLDKNN